MSKPKYSSYSIIVFILIGFAGVLFSLYISMDRADPNGPLVLILSVLVFIIGSVMAAFSRDEMLNIDIVTLLFGQRQRNVCVLLDCLQCTGPSLFISRDSVVNQLIRIPDAPSILLQQKCQITSLDEEKYLVLAPSCSGILDKISRNPSFTIPLDIKSLEIFLRELCVGNLNLMRSIAVSVDQDKIIVTTSGFRLFDICEGGGQASKKCCILYPCPVCSLIACILAKGLSKRVNFEKVTASRKNKSVQMVFSLS